MIVLTAVQLSVDAHYQFRIEAPDCEPWTTRDPVKAARMLQRCGVKNPFALVVHAQEWGRVEILETEQSEAM